MAKMQKLDQKQVPQVIGLGVVSVGVFGYALFNFALGGPKRDANPPVQKVDATATSPSPSETTAAVSSATGAAEAGTTAPGTTGPGGVQVVQNTPPAMQLPGQYNPDPFRSAVKSDVPPVNVTSKAVAAPPAVKKAMALPNATTGAPAETKPAETEAEREAREKAEKAKLLPPPPTRPEIIVRGTSVVDGMNLAILEVGQDHRVVQTGDLLTKDFKVLKIKLEGIEVREVGRSKRKDSFFVPVGAKSEPRKSDNAQDTATQS